MEWGYLLGLPPHHPAEQPSAPETLQCYCMDPRKALKGLTQISYGPGDRGWRAPGPLGQHAHQEKANAVTSRRRAGGQGKTWEKKQGLGNS